MPDNGSVQNSIWPLPKFYFKVISKSMGTVSFQEVSGLDTESQITEYRYGESHALSSIKMPGIAKMGNVSLKKGIFVKDNNFLKWYNEIKMNTIKREIVTIQLLDESGKPAMTWTLNNAWPVKISGTDFKSDANEVAVETLELAYEHMTNQ